MTDYRGTLQLKRGREKPVENRHPWIFSGAVEAVHGDPEPGDLVAVVDSRDRWLATAYYNARSQIRARILSWEADDIVDEAWWYARLQAAIGRRLALQLEPDTTAYRLVNAEADFLPGLVVDRYADYLVLQALTMGIERRKAMLASALSELTGAAGIVERSDVDVREKEGLPATRGLLAGEQPPPSVEIREHGLRFLVNLMEGHKTGLYLDQRENRALLGQPRFVSGKELLNVFAYTGGFAVLAAAAGAGPITNIDSSVAVLEQAERNMAQNGFDRPGDEYLAGDAFKVLRHYRDTGRQFDVIILDPPKFAHSQRDVQPACRGYKDLNWLAFRLLRPGGLLATFSCSGLVDADLFQKVVFGAAVDAGRDAQILFRLGQAPDHPILLTFPESAYLKGLLLRVV
ncbi:MAG: class I SAM-dependent rRNA methyltransferase [Chloroflexi bacterium]|nr:class I SAM-dependent rRNA methyltransferase [Chloroflexota bacterium]